MNPVSHINQTKLATSREGFHYANMPIQFILRTVKIDNFQEKKFDSFLIFAQNKDCGLHVRTASVRLF